MSEEIEMLISMAVSMEKDRAMRIVGDVSNASIGGKTESSPTQFMAGYQMACEEILHRLRHDEWQVCGAILDTADNAETGNRGNGLRTERMM